MNAAIEAIVNDPQWQPRYGFHDDHRGKDRRPEYLPAVQQVRSEFYSLLALMWPFKGGKALQLGIGPCNASHFIWTQVFGQVLSIDWRLCLHSDSHGYTNIKGRDTHDPEARDLAKGHGPYDFLFIDAGHKSLDVKLDFANFADLVRPGGIIAFHDALKRPGYEREIEVWQYLNGLRSSHHIHMIGSEVGTAWIRM